MNNLEYFKKDFIAMELNEDIKCQWGVDYKGMITPKRNITCDECKFFGENICVYKKIKWLLAEYKEGACWNNEEGGFLGSLSRYFKNVKFDFIKWSDEEPWAVEDLLKLEVRDD